jgi:hypothetical protein
MVKSRVIQANFVHGRARPGTLQAHGGNTITVDEARFNLTGSVGRALPEALQRKMEAFFEADFSDVRIHQGPQAQSIGAHAFTMGSHIYFAPGQYAPDSPRGQQLLGHELTHVLQQRAGRVRASAGAGLAVVNDIGLEAEADRMGARATAYRLPMQAKMAPQQRTPVALQARTGRTPVLIQSKWMHTPLNDQYWRWHVLINGVRWYRHKREDYDLYYYFIEQPNSSNARMTGDQGTELRRGDFSHAGYFEPPQGPIDPAAGGAGPETWQDADYAPFIYGVVRHNGDGPRWTEVTAYRQRNNQGQFEQRTNAAKKHPGAPRMPNPGLKNHANAGRYVFHLTTLRNLFFAPNSSVRGTGIVNRGLDPDMGGGPGGACETCSVLSDRRMLEGSVQNSRQVVAVTTAPSNLKMYGNQRHEFTGTALAKGSYTDMDLVGRESIVLRFRLRVEYIDAMEPDPQHPNDEFVRLIRGVRIPPGEIEALTGEGWKALSVLAALGELFPMPPTVRTTPVVSGPPNTRPLPNPWATPGPQLPPTLSPVLQGASGNINDNPDFWRKLDALIQHLAPNWMAIRNLLTHLQHSNRLILFRLRQSYREDLDLVLGYPDRVDEDVQREVIRLIDDVVREWESNRPRMLE